MTANAVELLAPAQKEFFETQGYLVIEDALNSAQVRALRVAVTRAAGAQKTQLCNTADILWRSPHFLDLIDTPRIFPKIWGLLGWNIWVNHTHFNINPPESFNADGSFQYQWHRDGGAMAFDQPQIGAPLLSIKVGYYLTDLRKPDHGQTYVVPGSHRMNANGYTTFGTGSEQEGQFSERSTPQKCGAIPIMAPPGACLLMDRRCIHSAYSPNLSRVTRMAVFINYAFRWLQAMDTQAIEPLSHQVLDPVRRQLLGLTHTVRPILGKAGSGLSGIYYPSDSDVPLRQHIAQTVGPSANAWLPRPL